MGVALSQVSARLNQIALVGQFGGDLGDDFTGRDGREPTGEAALPEAVTALVSQGLARLQAVPDTQASFLFLQAILGRLPSHALLRNFRRRVVIFTPDDNLAWLTTIVAKSSGSAAGFSSRIVTDKWVVVSKSRIESRLIDRVISAIDPGASRGYVSAKWAGNGAQLLESTTPSTLQNLILSSPRLLFFHWDLSVEQSQAVMALSGIRNTKLWLALFSGGESGLANWPSDPPDSHRHFMAWRALSLITGVVAESVGDFKPWRDVRAIFAPQGIKPFHEALIS